MADSNVMHGGTEDFGKTLVETSNYLSSNKSKPKSNAGTSQKYSQYESNNNVYASQKYSNYASQTMPNQESRISQTKKSKAFSNYGQESEIEYRNDNSSFNPNDYDAFGNYTSGKNPLTNNSEIMDETGKYSDEVLDSINEDPNFYMKEKSKIYNKNNSRIESSKLKNTSEKNNDSNIFGLSENLDEESFTVSQGTKNVGSISKNN